MKSNHVPYLQVVQPAPPRTARKRRYWRLNVDRFIEVGLWSGLGLSMVWLISKIIWG